jgi:hypothetical protein
MGFLPHRQQVLGAPFKPSFGLSGIMALHLPLPGYHVRPGEITTDKQRMRILSIGFVSRQAPSAAKAA